MVDKIMKLISDAGVCLQLEELHPIQEEKQQYRKQYKHLMHRVELIKKLISR